MDWHDIKRAQDHLDNERGAIIKDWGGKLSVALIYPDSYYVGMSNLGLHSLYLLFNAYDDVVCERVFYEAGNGRRIPEPVSIESQRPLTDYSVLAFTVSYESDYVNVVRILKAAGIPLYAEDRDERYPLIIAGGPCVTANPMPIAPFFDCLCSGEAEALLPALTPVLEENIGDERSALLKLLDRLPGIYVPLINNDRPVLRQQTADLDEVPVHSVVLTDDTELGGLYLVEIQRGCGWHCNFCLVSNMFRPVRYRSLERILEQVDAGLSFDKRIGLVGPAAADHPEIEMLLTRLVERGAQFSISSLRINTLTESLVGKMAQGGIRTITLAPEAGSERLRKTIRKEVTEDDILRAVSMVVPHPMQQMKLYFMLGLPGEREEDIEEIVRLSLKCKQQLDDAGSSTRVTLNISPFVPKAGTPFARLPMEQPDILEQRINRLKRSLQPHGIGIRNESPAWSEVQAVLSRGTRELAPVLADIDKFSLAGWRRACKKHHLDIGWYAHTRWPNTEPLPWALMH